MNNIFSSGTKKPITNFKKTAVRDFYLAILAMPGGLVQTVPRDRPPRSVTPHDKPRVLLRTPIEIDFQAKQRQKLKYRLKCIHFLKQLQYLLV